jgi:hypothetical protein
MAGIPVFFIHGRYLVLTSNLPNTWIQYVKWDQLRDMICCIRIIYKETNNQTKTAQNCFWTMSPSLEWNQRSWAWTHQGSYHNVVRIRFHCLHDSRTQDQTWSPDHNGTNIGAQCSHDHCSVLSSLCRPIPWFRVFKSCNHPCRIWRNMLHLIHGLQQEHLPTEPTLPDATWMCTPLNAHIYTMHVHLHTTGKSV